MAEMAIATIESAVRTKHSVKIPQFFAAFIAGFTAYVYGSAAGWLSPTLPLLQSEQNPALEGPPVTADQSSWLSSLPFLGALLACPLFSAICHHLGRKAAGYITAVTFIISWSIIMFSSSVYHLYIARFLAGVGNGGVIVFMPMYCGEIAEDDIRGALGTILPLLANIGTLVTYIVGSYATIGTLAAIELIVPITFLFFFYCLPETPVYLASKDKTMEAEKSIIWLRGGSKAAAQRDLQKILALSLKSEGEVSKMKLFFSRGTMKALAMCIACCIAQYLSGVPVIMNYCAQLMGTASKALSPEVSSIVIASVQVVGSLLSSFLVESAGRKTLLIFTEVTMGICMAVLGTYFHFQNQEYNLSHVSYLPVICVSLYLFFNAVGVSAITYILISETFHPAVRSIATTIVTCCIWLLAFSVTKLYPYMLAGLGLHGCFWLFAAVCAACTVFTVFQIPETKNRSLESILQELNGKAPEKTSEPIPPV